MDVIGGIGEALSSAKANVEIAEAALNAAVSSLEHAHGQMALSAGEARAAAAALACAAVKDVRPTDLDEIKAIRGSPPAVVQHVVCAVCSLLALHHAHLDPASEPAAQSCSDDPRCTPPVQGATMSAPAVRAGASTAATAGLLPWADAQRRLAHKDFKPALLNFDARCLLGAGAAKVVSAVKARLALESSGGTHGGRGVAVHAESGVAAGTATAAAQPSIATIAVHTGRAVHAAKWRRRRQWHEAASLLTGQVTMRDALYGSATMGALFTWVSRVLEHAHAMRESEAAERASRERAASEG